MMSPEAMAVVSVMGFCAFFFMAGTLTLLVRMSADLGELMRIMHRLERKYGGRRD